MILKHANPLTTVITSATKTSRTRATSMDTNQ